MAVSRQASTAPKLTDSLRFGARFFRLQFQLVLNCRGLPFSAKQPQGVCLEASWNITDPRNMAAELSDTLKGCGLFRC